jgi:hypothetical protein
MFSKNTCNTRTFHYGILFVTTVNCPWIWRYWINSQYRFYTDSVCVWTEHALWRGLDMIVTANEQLASIWHWFSTVCHKAFWSSYLPMHVRCKSYFIFRNSVHESSEGGGHKRNSTLNFLKTFVFCHNTFLSLFWYIYKHLNINGFKLLTLYVFCPFQITNPVVTLNGNFQIHFLMLWQLFQKYIWQNKWAATYQINTTLIAHTNKQCICGRINCLPFSRINNPINWTFKL